MKKISFALMFLVVLSLVSTGAAAQRLATANIPFSFSVHEKTFPAGHYELRYLGSSFLRLEQIGSNRGVTLFTPSSIQESTGMKLTFRRYGEQRFLAAISDSILQWQADIPKSELERNLQKISQTAKSETLRVAR